MKNTKITVILLSAALAEITLAAIYYPSPIPIWVHWVVGSIIGVALVATLTGGGDGSQFSTPGDVELLDSFSGADAIQLYHGVAAVTGQNDVGSMIYALRYNRDLATMVGSIILNTKDPSLPEDKAFDGDGDLTPEAVNHLSAWVMSRLHKPEPEKSFKETALGRLLEEPKEATPPATSPTSPSSSEPRPCVVVLGREHLLANYILTPFYEIDMACFLVYRWLADADAVVFVDELGKHRAILKSRDGRHYIRNDDDGKIHVSHHGLGYIMEAVPGTMTHGLRERLAKMFSLPVPPDYTTFFTFNESSPGIHSFAGPYELMGEDDGRVQGRNVHGGKEWFPSQTILCI